MFSYFFLIGLIIFAIWAIYKIGQSSGLGKPAPHGLVPHGIELKVLHVNQKTVILEAVEPERRHFCITTDSLADNIRPGDMVHRYESEKELKEAGVTITRNKWGIVQDFPTIVKARALTEV